MKLALVISSLRMGGAERVLALIAGGLAARGHDVTVLTFAPRDAAPVQALRPGIRLRNLDLAANSASSAQALRHNLRRLRRLRREFAALRPDVVISFMDATNVLCLLACPGLGLPVVVAERTDPSRSAIGPVWTRLRLRTYPLAARVLLLTSGLDGAFPPRIRRRCRVMPNPVVVDAAGPCPPAFSDSCVAALGRLVPEKGFDILLRAFALLARHHPDVDLWIFGEGPERPALEALRDSLGLRKRVRLPGAAARPGPILKRVRAFVLSSRCEGFPLALCEALACGAPTVCTRFSPGAGDIVRDGENALLVPPEDAPALAAALNRLLEDRALAERLAARGPEILARFAPERILDRWEALLNEVRAEGAGTKRGGRPPCAA